MAGTCSELVHPEDRARVLTDLEEVYNCKNPGIPTEYRILKATGITSMSNLPG